MSRTVITYGVFDQFHEGHRRLLERARALGDVLIVGVTTEEFAQERGKYTTADSLETRMENVRKTGLADQVIIEYGYGQKKEDILKFHVDVFAAGSDWTGKFDELTDICEVVYLERTPGISSSDIRNRRHPEVKIGLVGNGRIAPRFMREAAFINGLTISGVYNPHKESAERFAQMHNIRAYAEYEEMLETCDAVYVCTPHETHGEYVRKALQAGRHVLCEKPMVLSGREAQELYALAKTQDVILMEAMKTAYTPAFRKLLEVAHSGVIGEIYDIDAAFTRLTDPALREWSGPYGGSFAEVGSYVLLPVIKLYGTEFDEIRSWSVRNEEGKDSYTKMILRKGDRTATVRTGLGVKTEAQLILSGTKGYILAEAPWWKSGKFEIRREDPEDRTAFVIPYHGDGMRYEIGEFMNMIEGHIREKSLFSPAESICMAMIMERFFSSHD
ncbi:MAG: Gfo/Idh/MocA family oxidoreductase [Solobacterium sp.]|nr:Gfo/Idh/MocA family oxidoreductase [Solobacterium sp.]